MLYTKGPVALDDAANWNCAFLRGCRDREIGRGDRRPIPWRGGSIRCCHVTRSVEGTRRIELDARIIIITTTQLNHLKWVRRQWKIFTSMSPDCWRASHTQAICSVVNWVFDPDDNLPTVTFILLRLLLLLFNCGWWWPLRSSASCRWWWSS